MGQQQLLLLVLGIVIVGLAVVVGIQAFSENQKKANADAMVNDAIRIASDAQAWRLKPAAFGGGASDADWSDLTFAQMGYETGVSFGSYAVGDTEYGNLNGKFTLTTGGTVVITGTSYETDGTTVLNKVEVVVNGTTSADLNTCVNSATACPAAGTAP